MDTSNRVRRRGYREGISGRHRRRDHIGTKSSAITRIRDLMSGGWAPNGYDQVQADWYSGVG